MKIFHEKNILDKKLSEHPALDYYGDFSRSRTDADIEADHVSGIYYANTADEGSTHSLNQKSYCSSMYYFDNFIAILGHNCHLKIIDLRRNSNDKISFNTIVKLLQTIKSLKPLFLECLCLGHIPSDGILQELIAVIQNKPTLKYLELGGNVSQSYEMSFYNAATLKHFKYTLYKSQLLYLGLSCFTRQFTHHLIEDLDFENTALLDLRYPLSYAKYADFKVIDQKIKKLLQRNRDLADVRASIKSLRGKSQLHNNQLDLSGKVIKATDFLQLATVIIENKNLFVADLNLSDALLDMTEDAEILYVEGLVKLLNEKHSIRKLDISNSLFGKNTLILAVAAAIAQNCFLLKLTMKDTNFNPAILAQFVNVIDANRGLIDIELSTKLKKKTFDSGIFDKIDNIVKRNRKHMSKLHHAIKSGDVEDLQSALNSGANPFACVESKRKLKLFKKHQDLILELEDEADTDASPLKSKAQVEFDTVTCSELLRAQQQIRRSMISANDLITQYLQKHGNNGSAIMQYHLAQRYLNGTGITRDKKIAYHWLAAAAAQGHGPSQYLVGMMTLWGYGCTINYDEAIQWLLKARDNDQAEAAYQLGLIYFDQDELDDTNKNMKIANELGMPLAHLTLDLQQDSVTNQIQQDYSSRSEWDTFTIGGDAEDKEIATNRLIKAAKENISGAQFRLSQFYLHGISFAVDLKGAFDWCYKAAVQKHTLANYQLAKFYLHGQGCGQDFNMAIKHFEYAGQLGCADAYYELAMLYYPKDKLEMHTNITLALKYLTLAAEFYHAQANYKLGQLHDGKRLQFFSSEWTAKKYYEIALSFGYSKARIPLAKFKLDKQLESLLRTAPLTTLDEENSSDDEGASIKPI